MSIRINLDGKKHRPKPLPDYIRRTLVGHAWRCSDGNREKTIFAIARHKQNHADPEKAAEEQLDKFLQLHPEILEDYPEK